MQLIGHSLRMHFIRQQTIGPEVTQADGYWLVPPNTSWTVRNAPNNGSLWFPCNIKGTIMPCCKLNGKNVKPLKTKSNSGTLTILTEPNEEIRMGFAGPLTFRENRDDYNILVTVDRLTRYHMRKYIKLWFWNCAWKFRKISAFTVYHAL